MAEQLPGGFAQGDVIWGADGRKLKVVPKIDQKARDAFANTGVDFDGFQEVRSAEAREQDVEQLAEETLRNASPEFKRLLAEKGVFNIGE